MGWPVSGSTGPRKLGSVWAMMIGFFDQVTPWSVVRENHDCSTYDCALILPWSFALIPGGDRNRSQTAYTRLESYGSAVIACLSRPFVSSAVISSGPPQLSPPLVDLLG